MTTEEESKKLQTAWKEGYKFGFREGEKKTKNQLEGRIENIKSHCKANCANMWDEILRLDKLEPTTGIVLRYDETQRLIRILKKHKSHWWAGKLRNKIKHAFPEVDKVMETIREKQS